MDLPILQPPSIGDSEWRLLRNQYHTALRRYTESLAVINTHLAKATIPTRKEIDAEQGAAIVLSEARRAIWTAMLAPS